MYIFKINTHITYDKLIYIYIYKNMYKLYMYIYLFFFKKNMYIIYI